MDIFKVIDKASIKIQPAKYNKLKESCTKMQAIIDRGLLHKKMNKIPTYDEDLGFYRILIPNLDKKISKASGKSRRDILKRFVEEWLSKNLDECHSYETALDKQVLQYTYPQKQRGRTSSTSSVRSTPDIFRMSQAKVRRSSSKEF